MLCLNSCCWREGDLMTAFSFTEEEKNLIPYQNDQTIPFRHSNGFEFIVLYNKKKLIYNFAKQSSTDNSIQILQNVDIENQFYEELLEIHFEFNSDNEINKIYLAKQIGIVKIILNNGIEIFLTTV